MFKRFVFCLVIVSVLTGFFPGCYSAGKAAGKALKQVEKCADDFQKGLKDADE